MLCIAKLEDGTISCVVMDYDKLILTVETSYINDVILLSQMVLCDWPDIGHAVEIFKAFAADCELELVYYEN